MTLQEVINAPIEGRPNQWLAPQVIDLWGKWKWHFSLSAE